MRYFQRPAENLAKFDEAAAKRPISLFAGTDAHSNIGFHIFGDDAGNKLINIKIDPYEKIFTGMTRDGTFLVEGGEVTAGVRNFRFNESLIEMLSNVEALSAAVRASGEETFDAVVPAMKVRDFNFTEVTRF